MTFEEHVDQALREVRELLLAKHFDYGESNLEKYGVVGITIRMSDKLARLENLMRGKQSFVKEPTEDTLKDLIGYAIHYLIRLEGYNGSETEKASSRLLPDTCIRQTNQGNHQ